MAADTALHLGWVSVVFGALIRTLTEKKKAYGEGDFGWLQEENNVAVRSVH